MGANAEEISIFRRWVLATRPKTLLAAVSPVLLGTALAFSQNAGNVGIALVALFGAIGIQVGTNLANDYWDAKKGADGGDRLGPLRLTSSGLLPARQVFFASIFSFLVASAFGVLLILKVGWPIAVIGGVSVACGILYTAGRYSLAYLGLGDIFSFVFFGVVATAGSCYVQVGRVSWEAVAAGFGPGFYSVVLLAINNLRDRHTDSRAGKKTLAVRFGERFARGEVVFCMVGAAVVPWLAGDFSILASSFLSVFVLVLSLPVVLPVLRGEDGKGLNRLLFAASLANLIFCSVVSVCLLL